MIYLIDERAMPSWTPVPVRTAESVNDIILSIADACTDNNCWRKYRIDEYKCSLRSPFIR